MADLTTILARALNPVVWRTPARAARKLYAFALAEHGSMLDLRLAAASTPSPARAAAYLRHADDEARHTQMFARRAGRLASEAGRPLALGPVMADSERLFEALGEVGFLAFVHLGEARAIRQFEVYEAWFRAHARDTDAALFATILGDERQHSAYTWQLLCELTGDVHHARKAVRRAQRWELGRQWLRAGRAVAERVYFGLTLVVYGLAAPLAVLVRLVRPERRGFLAPPK